MAYTNVFKRYELKYMMTLKQKQSVLEAMKRFMTLDEYGRTTIRNIYYDTDDYLLVRRSIDKPIFKEKLRVRSYCRAKPESHVFVELKRKYDSIVYKRRVSIPEKEAMDWISGKEHCKKNSQISREIDYFLELYKTLHPVVFLSYEREAFFANDGSDFRVTFDENILVRQEELSLEAEAYGTPLLPPGMTLMELKCSGGIPLWMTEVLSKEHIYKTTYSKYGTAYEKIIFPEKNGFADNNYKEAALHA